MTKTLPSAGRTAHILLWSVATLYLLVSPALYHALFRQDGKPLEVWDQPPGQSGNIRYNVEDLKYWSGTLVSYEEGETYALWGWAFVNAGPGTVQADFDRFAVLTRDSRSLIFPMTVYPRPGVQDRFHDLGLADLTSSGFYSILARNSLDEGEYQIGILFEHRQGGTRYFVETNKVLVRSPNHLTLAPRPK